MLHKGFQFQTYPIDFGQVLFVVVGMVILMMKG